MKIRIYYEDTDCGNVVYYANYLKFMERGRTEFMRERGVDFGGYHRTGMLFVVAEANVKYHASAYYDDLLDVDTKIGGISPVTITFITEIKNENGRLLADGKVKVACINKDGKVRRIPEEIIGAVSPDVSKA
jgi:acyl-CoA thioester hydrolase